MTIPPLMIASVGNPAPYLNTLHSAGHTLLAALATHLQAPPLHASQYKAGLSTLFTSTTLSPHHPLLLFQSTSLMNVSGPGIAAAWRSFNAQFTSSPTTPTPPSSTSLDPSNTPPSSKKQSPPRLIILHDDLEQVLGRYNVKSGAGRSARGHNGLKSVLDMPGMNALEFVRVGIGIGPRPATRDSEGVARFVLRRMSTVEIARVQALAPSVWDAVVREVGRMKG